MKIYLIDGSSYIYRAFYAMRSLTTSKGQPSNAVYIFARMLIKLLKDEQPEYICFVKDAKGETHRHEMYAEYKANRQRMPEDLVVQIPYIHDVVRALGIPEIEQQGLEADDLIAALAGSYRDRAEVLVVSGDKDLMQLVDGRVTVWDTLKDKRFDAAAVEEKFGVGPEYVADYLAIMGDSSDNVPGVPGLGAKGAAKLIAEWGHLENIIENAGSLTPPRASKAIAENIEQARLSLELVKLDMAYDAGLSLEELKIRPQDTEKLVEIFSELEFKGLVKDFAGKEPEAAPAARAEVKIDYAAPKKLSGEAGFYYLNGLGSAVARGADVNVQLAPQTLWDADSSLDTICDASLDLTVYDAKELLRSAAREQKVCKAQLFDVLLAAYCVDASTGTATLEQLAGNYLDQHLHTVKELTGSGRAARSLSSIAKAEAGPFLASHAAALSALREKLTQELDASGTRKVYDEMELPLMQVLSEMEIVGMALDSEVLRKISIEISSQVATLESDIYAMAGQQFNINSTQQLGKILFEELGLPVIKKTKTGYSTDNKVLNTLARDFELPAKIIEYRTLTKLQNTYVEALPKLINPQTGRLHGKFNQAVTATGRISSSEPNLQNIPIRSELGRRIREAFVAPAGYKFLSADYSQIELRVLAHITQDPTLLESFNNDLDIHARTAAEVFGVPLDEVTPNQRREAKVINFGIIYGMGPHKLSGELGIRQKVAKEYIENYLAKYPGVRDYMERICNEAAETGFVTTLMGRRRSIAGINSRNFNEREGAKRIAINTPMQGTAADIIKVAMIRIQQKLAGMQSRMLLQVHDELLFEVHESEIDQVKALVKSEMENAYQLDVPLIVDMGIGDNWAEAH